MSVVLSILLVCGARADPTFSNTIDTHQIYGLGDKNAATFFDADRDGDLDVFLPSRSSQGLLYRNAGGTYEDVTTTAGLSGLDCYGAVVGDINNDGHIDLCVHERESAICLLRNNGDMTFTDISTSASLGGAPVYSGLSFFDYDGNEYIDLISYPGNIVVHVNNGNETFTSLDHTQTGMDALGALPFALDCVDYNGDGLMDVFSNAVSDESLHLWEHRADQSFISAEAEAQIPNAKSHATGFGDVDNDLWPDLYLKTETAGGLYRNDRDGTFTDILASAGIPALSACPLFGDFDNDGWVDLFLVGSSSNSLHRNNGDATFTDISTSAGITVTANLAGPSVADFDDDGDLDVYVPGGNASSILYENDLLPDPPSTDKHWVEFQIRGGVPGANACGIGVKIVVTAGTYTGARFVYGSNGTVATQNNLEVHFGLGSESQIDRVDFYAHGELKRTIRDLPVDQTHIISEPPKARFVVY